MDSKDIADLRLRNLLLTGSACKTAAQVVSHMGAVQAQDVNAARWAIAQRFSNSAMAEVDRALADGSIVRTWPMRRTLHYVAAEDATWMLDLLAGKAARASSLRHHQVGLTHQDVKKAESAIGKALRGGRHITREGMYDILRRIGIDPDGYRGMHILAHLALEKLIIFGRPEGKQQTFVLFDEWISKSRKLDGQAARSELVRRYFVSHGPATAYDLNWWSGLNMTDIRRALADLTGEFEQVTIDGRTYYWGPGKGKDTDAAYLLPPFDEYLVGYKYRGDVLHELRKKDVVSINGVFKPVIVIGGQVVGLWRKEENAKGVTAMLDLFRSLKRAEKALVSYAAERYAEYLKAPLLSITV